MGIHYCATTLQPGESLKKCSRCKCTYYSSAEAQKKHWSIHKRSCKLISDKEKQELSSFKGSDLDRIVKEIARTLPSGNHRTAALMKRLRELLNDGADGMDVEMEMHNIGRSMLFQATASNIQSLWACPGMVDLFLGENLQNPISDSDDFMFSSPTYVYCYLFFNLLLSGAVKPKPSHCSAHDGTGTLRTGPIADAVRKKVLEVWYNPFSRKAGGDAMAAAASFAFEVLKKYQERLGDLHLMLIALLEEMTGWAGQSYAKQALNFLIKMWKEEKFSWEDVSIEGRALAVLKVTQMVYDPPTDEVPSPEVYGMLMNSLCGDEDTRLKVWKEASIHPGAEDHGIDFDTRAFFHYLVRKDDKTLSTLDELVVWSEIPSNFEIESHKKKGTFTKAMEEASIERDLCFELLDAQLENDE